MPKTTKKTEEVQKNDSVKACPLNKEKCTKVCDKTKQCCQKAKTFVLVNYKKPAFIIAAVIALLAIFCISHCSGETTKLHFSKAGIIKEVISGNEHTYYACKRDFKEGVIQEHKFYISCETLIIEN